MNELLSEENVAVVLKAAAVGRRCQLNRTISIILCLIQKCFLRTSKTTSKKWLLEFPDCCANSSTSTVDQVLINGSRSSDFKGWFLCQPPIFIKNQPTNKKIAGKKGFVFYHHGTGIRSWNLQPDLLWQHVQARTPLLNQLCQQISTCSHGLSIIIKYRINSLGVNLKAVHTSTITA